MMAAEGHMHSSAIFFSHTSLVREKLTELLPQGFINFKEHCDVYFDFLEDSFKSQPNPLKRSTILRTFEKRLVKPLTAEHQIRFLEICCKYQPLEFTQGTRSCVSEFLKKQAEVGEDISNYEDVQLSIPSNLSELRKQFKSYVLGSLIVTDVGCKFSPDKERLSWALLKLFFEKKLNRRAEQDDALNMFQKLLSNASKSLFEDFVYGTNELQNPPEMTLFKFVMGKSDALLKGRNQYREWIITWIETHAKYSAVDYGAAKKAKWADSYLRMILPAIQKISPGIPKRLQEHSKTDNRTGITAAVGWYRVLVDFAVQGIISDSLDRQLQHFNKITRHADSFISVTQVPAVDLLRDSVFGIIRNHILPQLQNCLHFDLSNPSKYITQTDYNIAANISTVVSATALKFPDIRTQHFNILKGWSTDCVLEKEFIAFTNKLGKKVFAHYNTSLHNSTTSLCENELLRHMRTVSKKEDVDKNVWSLYKELAFEKEFEYNYKKTTKLEVMQTNSGLSGERKKYLDACALLPPSLLNDELPVIKKIIHLLLSSQIFGEGAAEASRFKMLKACVEEHPTYKTRILEQYGGISVDEYKAKILERTTDRDMHTRMAGHVDYLTKSLQLGITEFSEALKYSSNRIKNEAGLTRPLLYDMLVSNMQRIVTASLNSQNTETITTITSMLEKLIKDDVSKRDSVGKNRFSTISDTIGKTVLSHDLGVKSISHRQTWFQCAYRILFIIMKSIRGEKSWVEFKWPGLNLVKAPLTNWMSESGFKNNIRPVVLKQTSSHIDDLLRAECYRTGKLEITKYTGITTEELVSLVTDSYDVVKKELLQLSDEGSNTWLGLSSDDAGNDDAELQKHVTARMSSLIAFCGPRWIEVDFLKKFILKSISNLQSHKGNKSNYETCKTLFNQFVSMYPNNWPDVFLVSELNDCLFAAAQIRPNELSSSTQNWWLLGVQKDQISFEGLSEEEKNFVLANCGRLPPANRLSMEFKQMVSMRQLTLTMKLLNISQSAIHLPEVKKIILSMRDDILDQYFGKEAALFVGPFCRTEVEKGKKFKFPLTGQELATLNGTCSDVYSKLSLAIGMSRGASTYERSSAITTYVASPTTSHQDVISLLDELSSSQSQDDSLHNIVESIVLTVFQTDSAWNVLAYLLSPDIIKKMPQRTTSSILVNFSKWVHTHKVVGVVGILLAPCRRGVITLLLQKTILRILVQAGTTEAGKLLHSEWKNRNTYNPPTHTDVVRELVTIAVTNLEKNNPLSEKAWEILNDVAEGDLPEDTALLLLSPKWSPHVSTAVSFDVSYSPPTITPAMGDEERSFVKLFNTVASEPCTVTFQCREMCQKLTSVLRKLIDNKSTSNALRILAMHRVILLSPMRVGEEDFATLDSLRETVLTLVESLTVPVTYKTKVSSMLYAACANQVIKKELGLDKYKSQSASIAQAEVGLKHPAAVHVRKTFETMLDILVETPPSQTGKYTYYTLALLEMKRGLSDIFNHVVYNHLKSKLAILSACRSHIQQIA
eukprot:TRINITY_DN15137_c0_g1_i1.p1 TRINITY_DN15137_c0_g1~~TRINITY_DN15137_c0_g1_i1.p1  ORF type:complete len:1724 (+),score=351.63 TRINITY_DN15137_c0_g1_i1:639-5174(+)